MGRMTYDHRILEFIQKNEPTNRKELVKEFNTITPKTVYQNVRKLIAGQKIFENEYGFLSTTNEHAPVWKVPATLTKFMNLSPIANAFARQNKELNVMAAALSQKYPEQTAVLLTDLLIIANLQNEDKELLANSYEFKTKVDMVKLTNYFSQLEELISQYSKAELVNS